MNHSRSIDLAETQFPELVTAGRTERGWSKSELAARAGLSTKVIHQIESRSRDRFFEKTLLLIADALETRFEDLLRPIEPDDPDRPAATAAQDGPAGPDLGASRRDHRRRRIPVRLVPLFAVAVLIAVTPHLIRSLQTVHPAQLEVNGRSVLARDRSSGRLLWSREFEASVYYAKHSPWPDGSVVVGLQFDAPDGGRVLLLRGKTGATLWDRSPDVDLAARAFGEEILDGLGFFSPVRFASVDLDGDGQLKLAVSFLHIRHYPSSIMIIDRQGGVVGEYFNRGHVYGMAAVDLDGEGRQALVCVGCNNKEPYHGGAVFILDRDHCSGAAVDPYNGGNLEVGDGSRSRILLPAFEPQMMQWLGASRLAATEVKITRSIEGDITLLVSVGHDGMILHLLLDADLNPLGFHPTDVVPRTVATWPVDDPAGYGPNCPKWRTRWMQGIVKVTERPQPLLTLQ